MKQFYETYKDADEKLSALLRQISWTNNLTIMSRSLPKAFTEKGLYMLATILKSQRAKRDREPSPDPIDSCVPWFNCRSENRPLI